MTTCLYGKHYLHVTIDLPSAKAEAFIGHMKQLIPSFTGPCPPPGTAPVPFGWTLIAAMRCRAGNDGVRFVHVWQIPDPGRPLLWETMQEVGTSEIYGALDQLVEVEVQDLFHSNDYYTPFSLAPLAPTHWLQESLDMSADVVDLVAFEAQMAVCAEQMREQFGWTLVLPLMAITGRLRRFIHLWAPSDLSRLDAADQWLRSRPIYSASVRSRTVSTLEAVHYQ
jgi:hypothetical protein